MPTETIGDNTGDDYAGTEDTELKEGSPTLNQGGSASFQITKYSAGDWRMLINAFSGISNLPSSLSVSAAAYYLYQTTGEGADHVFSLTRLLRNWVENQAAWTIYSTGNSWGTAGGLAGTDKSATLTADLNANLTLNEYKSVSSAQLAADIEGFADGTYPNYGWHFERTDSQNDGRYRVFTSSEGTDGQRPYLSVTYAAAGGGALLDAAVTCAATVAVTLTSVITMAASVAASGVISAALTTSILLSGTVTGAASTAAALTTDIRLDAAPALTVNATGALATAIPLLDAAVTATASQAAGLTTQIEMGSTVSAAAAATGELVVGLDLDAAVTGSAAADGILSTQIPLSASIAASSVTAAQLTTGISLAANVGGQAASTGEVATDITLTANAAAAASASGILNGQKIFNTVQRSANFQSAAAKTALFNVTRNNTVFFTRNRTKEVLF